MNATEQETRPETKTKWQILTDDGQHWCLVARGAVQSVDVQTGAAGYWGLMLPDERPQRALLLGFGGGTVAALLTRRFGPIPIVGVDRDASLRGLAGRPEAFGTGVALPNVRMVTADAFDFIRQESGPFDYIAVDLYDGLQIARGVTGRPFLRQLLRLAPGGHVVFNFHRNRRLNTWLNRLDDTFRLVWTVSIEENVVAHCRAP